MIISNNQLKIATLKSFLQNPKENVEIAGESLEIVQANRDFLENKLKDANRKYYGINTGFGALYDVTISASELEQLQQNLVMSHACGMGDEVRPEVVRLMLLLKIKGLSLGYSGVSKDVLDGLLSLLNNDILPIVFEQGSLGASGDLAPLAHLSLPLLGLGMVRYRGEKMGAEQALKLAGLSPIKLKAKEGLALLNGTQFMSAWGCFSIIESERVAQLADFIAAISMDAFDASLTPFHPTIHKIRNHKGQIESAQNVLKFLADSEISQQHKTHLQDPYSFRCVPQVHGAVRTTLAHVKEVLEREINAVTDNPLVLGNEDLIISGGNFHGEPLALALDYLAISMNELANISERRTFQLISGTRNLPKFLVQNGGLNSGFMIPQYTAASIVSMNKQLATPASIDSITSSGGQEDHVSMGANAAVKCYKIIHNVEKVLAIEFMNAMQALEFRKPLHSSPFIEKVKADYRKIVFPLAEDRMMYEDIQKTLEFTRSIFT